MSEFERLALLALVLLVYGLLCTYCAWRYRRGLSALGVIKSSAHGAAKSAHQPAFLVAYASQTGTAAALAQRSAALLGDDLDYQILPLNKVDHEVLSYTSQALFVVSTYGEGEAPDNGMAFAGRYLRGQAVLDLSHLQFTVLALGDKLYQQFCAFGHHLHQGLSQLGATPLFEPLEACASEGYDGEGLLQQWRQGLKLPSPNRAAQQLVGSDAATAGLATQQHFTRWRLVSRTHLNPGSPGAPVFHLCLSPQDQPLPEWQAGDLVEIAFETLSANTVKRKYSIASLPADGTIELIVRQHINQDGSLGLGSGWLTAKAPLYAEMDLRIAENPAFYGLEAERALIMIGSGTGLAGLRAHIKQRAQQGVCANWLMLGERSPEHDNWLGHEITAWQQSAVLSRVELAFSRQANNAAYVQDLMSKHADELRQWLQNGAAVYVCGSRLGMAQEVDHVLQQILGPDSYQQLLARGLYRRDIY